MSRKKTHNFLNLLQDLETFLEKWYFNAVFLGEDGTPNCSLAILRVNACQIRKVLHSNLQDSLKLWVRGGSHTLSQWLERVIVRFREIEVEWEKSRQLALSKAQSSLTAYSNLINRVKQEEDKLVCESALRALKIRYRELINAEALSIAGLMVSELVEELIRFRERINATDTLLTRFQEKIHQKMSEGRNFDSNSRLGEEIESARANAIRDCLVKKLGQSFAHWGNLSPTEHEIILEEVLRQAGKIALSTIVSRY